MRIAAICLGFLLGALLLTGGFESLAATQDPQDDDVRGAFLTTRPKTAEKPSGTTTGRTGRRHPKPGPTKPPVTPTPTPGPGDGTNPPAGPGREARQRLGLGFTLFTRNSTGLAVRVDPLHEFHKGDLVRVLLETNADGYLYIFNTTDGGKPMMVYPNPQLDEAGNYLQAHVPFEIPASTETEERLRWFTFDQYAGTERLYFVFTREPLPNVPIEDDLVKYCGENKTECAWRPGDDLWASLQKEMEAPQKSDNAKKFGKALSEPEHDALTRGIGLAKNDPEPTLVVMTASANPTILVTGLELYHR
jgi:Domain of unknown function (DUF4384)